MKKILSTLLALVAFASVYAAETINVVSIEEDFYVPSDAQYSPYYRCDMFAEDGVKYSFVIEKRLDSNGMPVNDRIYTLNDMDDWASYAMIGMFEYYDYTSVKFVRTVNAAGKVNIKADVTDERGKSYTLVYPAAGTGEGETYTFKATYGQAAYFGTATGVEGDWLLMLADENENIFAEISILSCDGEHIAGTYSVADGTLVIADDVSNMVLSNGSKPLIKNGSISLSYVDMDGTAAYYVNAALQDANGNNYVINRSFVQFLAYDMFGYMTDPTGETIDYFITLKDNETTGIKNVESNDNQKVRKTLRNGRIVIERDGMLFNIDGTKAK